jgi:hypothetical protein
VELTACEQGDEGGVDFIAVVAADEDPVLATDRLAPEGAFRSVVVDWEAAVIEESWSATRWLRA